MPARRSSGFVAGSSMSAFPLVTRRPEASAARNTASVWRTVPMSRIAVVPPARSSARPSRAETSSVASSCAASPGQTCVLSHGRSGRSSGPFLSSVWQRWMCVWTNPGRSQRPRASRRSSGRPAAAIWRARRSASPWRAVITPSSTSTCPPTVTSEGRVIPMTSAFSTKRGVTGGIIFFLRQDRPFVREQPALSRNSSAIAGELSVRCDDAVARHDDRDGIPRVRARDRADGGRFADRARELRV